MVVEEMEVGETVAAAFVIQVVPEAVEVFVTGQPVLVSQYSQIPCLSQRR